MVTHSNDRQYIKLCNNIIFTYVWETQAGKSYQEIMLVSYKKLKAAFCELNKKRIM